MIETGTGDLLKAPVEALVNTVNTVGVMGKGLALQFRQAFPANYAAYKKACDRKELEPGRMFVFDTGLLTGPRIIINFPTKRHWKGKSKIEDVKTGLRDLVRILSERRVKSVAVPPLGCGQGGLAWQEVRPLIVKALGELETRVLLFGPEDGTRQASDMVVNTAKPKLTPARAALLLSMSRYGEPGTTFTKLELQKLCYFQMVAGEPSLVSSAKFEPQQYGPYSEPLNHLLQRMEGHFIRGYGDRTVPSSVVLLPAATKEATLYLSTLPDTRRRAERVNTLIKNFEAPHGLELLATAHWVATKDSPTTDIEMVTARVHEWSERKREKFPREHIEVAMRRLDSNGWFATGH